MSPGCAKPVSKCPVKSRRPDLLFLSVGGPAGHSRHHRATSERWPAGRAASTQWAPTHICRTICASLPAQGDALLMVPSSGSEQGEQLIKGSTISRNFCLPLGLVFKVFTVNNTAISAKSKCEQRPLPAQRSQHHSCTQHGSPVVHGPTSWYFSIRS